MSAIQSTSSKGETPYTSIPWKTRSSYILSKFPKPVPSLGLGGEFKPEGWDPKEIEAQNKKALSDSIVIPKINISKLTLLRAAAALLAIGILVAIVFAAIAISAAMPVLPLLAAIPVLLIAMKVSTAISMGMMLAMVLEGALAFGYNAIFLRNPPADPNKSSHHKALEMTTLESVKRQAPPSAQTVQRKIDQSLQGQPQAEPQPLKECVQKIVKHGAMTAELAGELEEAVTLEPEAFYAKVKDYVDQNKIHPSVAYSILHSYDQQKKLTDEISAKIQQQLRQKLGQATQEQHSVNAYTEAYNQYLQERKIVPDQHAGLGL